MDCKEFENYILDYIFDEIDPDIKEQIENHIKNCEKCDKIYQSDIKIIEKIKTEESQIEIDRDKLNKIDSFILEKSSKRFQKKDYRQFIQLFAAIFLIGFTAIIYYNVGNFSSKSLSLTSGDATSKILTNENKNLVANRSFSLMDNKIDIAKAVINKEREKGIKFNGSQVAKKDKIEKGDGDLNLEKGVGFSGNIGGKEEIIEKKEENSVSSNKNIAKKMTKKRGYRKYKSSAKSKKSYNRRGKKRVVQKSKKIVTAKKRSKSGRGGFKQNNNFKNDDELDDLMAVKTKSADKSLGKMMLEEGDGLNKKNKLLETDMTDSSLDFDSVKNKNIENRKDSETNTEDQNLKTTTTMATGGSYKKSEIKSESENKTLTSDEADQKSKKPSIENKSYQHYSAKRSMAMDTLSKKADYNSGKVDYKTLYKKRKYFYIFQQLEDRKNRTKIENRYFYLSLIKLKRCDLLKKEGDKFKKYLKDSEIDQYNKICK